MSRLSNSMTRICPTTRWINVTYNWGNTAQGRGGPVRQVSKRKNGSAIQEAIAPARESKGESKRNYICWLHRYLLLCIVTCDEQFCIYANFINIKCLLLPSTGDYRHSLT